MRYKKGDRVRCRHNERIPHIHPEADADYSDYFTVGKIYVLKMDQEKGSDYIIVIGNSGYGHEMMAIRFEPVTKRNLPEWF